MTPCRLSPGPTGPVLTSAIPFRDSAESHPHARFARSQTGRGVTAALHGSACTALIGWRVVPLKADCWIMSGFRGYRDNAPFRPISRRPVIPSFRTKFRGKSTPPPISPKRHQAGGSANRCGTLLKLAPKLFLHHFRIQPFPLLHDHADHRYNAAAGRSATRRSEPEFRSARPSSHFHRHQIGIGEIAVVVGFFLVALMEGGFGGFVPAVGALAAEVAGFFPLAICRCTS
jgi:hypothetical protein